MKAAVLSLALATPALADPAFVDRSDALVGTHAYIGGWEHFVGGGVAVFDCNGDEKHDIFAVGGEAPARLWINETPGPGEPFSFRAADIASLTGVTGAYPLDIDGDGPLDLVVLRVGPNLLLKGKGDCTFTDATPEWGFDPGDRWSTAFSATWEPGQDRPTLAIGNYVDRSDPEGPFGACDVNELHRPSGQGYGAPVLLEPGFCALSMLISDWRRTGTPELRVSNDRHYYIRDGYEQMWRLEPLQERGEADGWARVSLWGMGIASGDITGNGYPDAMLTSMGDQLMMLNEAGTLSAAPYSIGTYAHRPHAGDDGRPSTGWHAEFGDVDNDGLLDLFIAKGNVDQMPGSAMKDPNNLLMQAEDGTFREVSETAGIAATERSRGAAMADFDGDGRLDLVVVNRRAPMELWQNVTESVGNWLAITPRMPGTNTRAVGTWIEIRTEAGIQVREVTAGGGHAGGQSGPIHVGIGAFESADLRAIWPDGTVTDWMPVTANQRIEITYGEDRPG